MGDYVDPGTPMGHLGVIRETNMGGVVEQWFFTFLHLETGDLAGRKQKHATSSFILSRLTVPHGTSWCLISEPHVDDAGNTT